MLKQKENIQPSENHFLKIKKLSSYLYRKNFNQKPQNHRNLYEIIVLLKGGINIRIGESNHQIKGNAMCFLAPGQISKISTFDKETEGFYIAFDTDYFLLCLKNQVQLCFYPFFQFDKHPILHLSKPQTVKFEALIQKIDFEYNNRKSLNDDLLTKLYLNILLIEIERLYQFKSATGNGESSRKKLIASKFKQLVEKNFMTMRKVSTFADTLYISPSYLNDTVREITGQSASTIIHQRIILEAKAMLVQTELTINEVAQHLQYGDTSYFCRFFRTHTGVSPQAFREGNHF